MTRCYCKTQWTSEQDHRRQRKGSHPRTGISSLAGHRGPVFFKRRRAGAFLVAQRLGLHASPAGDVGSVPVRELGSHMPHSRAKTKDIEQKLTELKEQRAPSPGRLHTWR